MEMSGLWNVTVYLGSEGSRQIGMMFNDRERAHGAYIDLGIVREEDGREIENVEISDDFGSLFSCDPRDIIARLLQDTDVNLELQVEIAVKQANGNRRVQRQTQNTGGVVVPGINGQAIGRG